MTAIVPRLGLAVIIKLLQLVLSAMTSLSQSHRKQPTPTDPDTEDYLLDPNLRGLTVKISQARKENTIPMIFRLNDTGTCGRI